MADLVIRKSDGWIEIEGADRTLSGAGKRMLWQYAAVGDVTGVALVLETEAHQALQKAVGGGDIDQIRALILPDDIRGDYMRVWVKKA